MKAANIRTEPDGASTKIDRDGSPSQRHLSSSDDEESVCSIDYQETTSTGRKIKQFKCDICGNCYTQKHNLSDHMNLHAGDRPFECQYCAKTFTKPSVLRLHRKTHFPPTLECDYCPKMFTQKCNRDRHMRTHKGYNIRSIRV